MITSTEHQEFWDDTDIRLNRSVGINCSLVTGAECSRCFEFIYSKSRHDFVSCKCGAISLDGGQKDYFKVSYDLTRLDSFPKLEKRIIKHGNLV